MRRPARLPLRPARPCHPVRLLRPSDAMCRGAAAVELMLSITFLFLFAIAAADFAKGLVSVSRGRRAARQVAWMQARHDADDAMPEAPSPEDVKKTHFLDVGGDVTSVPGTDSRSSPISEVVESFSLFDLGGVGRGVIDFIGGKIDLTTATVKQTLGGVRILNGQQTQAIHKVSLDSRREKDDPPRGWWDPYEELKDKILPK